MHRPCGDDKAHLEAGLTSFPNHGQRFQYVKASRASQTCCTAVAWSRPVFSICRQGSREDLWSVPKRATGRCVGGLRCPSQLPETGAPRDCGRLSENCGSRLQASTERSTKPDATSGSPGTGASAFCSLEQARSRNDSRWAGIVPARLDKAPSGTLGHGQGRRPGGHLRSLSRAGPPLGRQHHASARKAPPAATSGSAPRPVAAAVRRCPRRPALRGARHEPAAPPDPTAQDRRGRERRGALGGGRALPPGSRRPPSCADRFELDVLR